MQVRVTGVTGYSASLTQVSLHGFRLLCRQVACLQRHDCRLLVVWQDLLVVHVVRGDEFFSLSESR